MRILDLFCGAGGASVGYYRAGFDVVGVDLNPQPFYPFEFIQGNALSFDYEFLMSFDAIHASPPCQQYSTGSVVARKRGKTYPDLFKPVEAMLIAVGIPFVIENVQGSPSHGIGLCGSMFGLGVRRHRIFTSNIDLSLCGMSCSCSSHTGEYITVAGSSFAKNDAALAMGIDWPIDKFQLKEAIPPIYTEFLGKQLYETLNPGNSETLTRCDSETEKLRGFIVSHERQDNTVSEMQTSWNTGNDNVKLLISVSEFPGFSVSNRRCDSVSENPVLTIANERRCIPVTRRCGDPGCNKPLPQGTARRKYCNDLCRLRAFRSC
jgi:DNA (cytosine-5)-methyltransferase 1